MGASGTAVIDFGAAPGKTDASVVVTGQASIATDSEVGAWLLLTATSDHSADEHRVEAIQISAGAIVAGTGFTIYGDSLMQTPGPGSHFIYGQWNVAWAWN